MFQVQCFPRCSLYYRSLTGWIHWGFKKRVLYTFFVQFLQGHTVLQSAIKRRTGKNSSDYTQIGAKIVGFNTTQPYLGREEARLTKYNRLDVMYCVKMVKLLLYSGNKLLSLFMAIFSTIFLKIEYLTLKLVVHNIYRHKAFLGDVF